MQQNGTGRTSKIAALAAARKKKEQERSSAANTEICGDEGPAKPVALALLDRLRQQRNDRADFTVEKEQSQFQANLLTVTDGTRSRFRATDISNLRSDTDENRVNAGEASSSTQNEEIPEDRFRNLRAEPSLFAQTLLGSGGSVSATKPRHPEGSTYFAILPENVQDAKSTWFSGQTKDNAKAKQSIRGKCAS